MIEATIMRDLLHPFAFPAALPREQEEASFTPVLSSLVHPSIQSKDAPGALLRQERIRLGFTQQMLADFAQVGLSTIYRAERGASIRVDSVYRLCSFFTERYHRTVTAAELGLI